MGITALAVTHGGHPNGGSGTASSVSPLSRGTINTYVTNGSKSRSLPVSVATLPVTPVVGG